MPKKPPTKKKTEKVETALVIPAERGQRALDRASNEAMNFIAKLCPELPNYFEGKREMVKFCKTAFVAIKREPKLLKCEPESLAIALGKAASLKLEVAGPLQHCWPIPFKNTCQLIIGYRAWVLLMLRNSGGYVKWINAEVARKNDKFKEARGTSPKIEHVPADDDSPLTHAYAVAGLANGQTTFKVLNKMEVMKAKASARGADKPDSPWKNHEAEMWKKTAILRIAKILPIDSEEFSMALGHEEELSDFSQEPEGTVTVIPPEGGGNKKLKAAIKTPPATQPLTVLDGGDESGAEEDKPQGDGLFSCASCGNKLGEYGDKAICINTDCAEWNKPIEA